MYVWKWNIVVKTNACWYKLADIIVKDLSIDHFFKKHSPSASFLQSVLFGVNTIPIHYFSSPPIIPYNIVYCQIAMNWWSHKESISARYSYSLKHLAKKIVYEFEPCILYRKTWENVH